MADIKLTPTVRFPQFSDVWAIRTLGSLSKNVMYGMNSSAIAFDGENKYLRITDIDEDTRQFTPRPLTSPDGNIEDRYKLKQGDIVFARTGAGVGRSYLYRPTDGNLLYAGFLIKFSIAGADPFFVYANTFRSHYHKWVKLMSMRSGQPGINAEEYKEFSFGVPSLPEQQKIASFLTAVDDNIQQLNKKKALLEQYKKGVMQQLFSQTIQFKDEEGNEFPDWEEKMLGEIGETFNGLTGKSKENFGTGHPYITYKQIFDSSTIDVSKFEYVDVGKNESQNLVKFGDVFFTTSSETPKEIGYASVLLSEVETVYLNSFCFGYRIHDFDRLSPYYAKCLFRSPQFRIDIQKLAQGSTRYNMSKVGLMKLSIVLPTVEEQTKIANFLSAIDEKINRVDQQIEYTKQFKKGLLQQMFV